MFKIALINMPFAAFNMPSLGLTQLKWVLDHKYSNLVDVKIHYLNQDFMLFIGNDLYNYISNSMNSLNCGLGEWFFRRTAFPQLIDNKREYLLRHFPYNNKQTETLKRSILHNRDRVDKFLDDLIDKYALWQVDLVGFSSMFAQNTACFSMALKLKARNTDIITVMGGSNCLTPMGEEIAKHVKSIDYVFSGPALKSFPEFVQYLLNNDRGRCDRIGGVFSKTNCYADESSNNGTMGEEFDINSKIELDYDSFLTTFEQNFPDEAIKPILTFRTSKGCWWGQCTFCSGNEMEKKYLSMSPQIAIEQFKSLFRYSNRCTDYDCVDNIMPKKFPKEVFSLLNPPENATIFYEVKSNLRAEDLRLMKNGGIKKLQVGIESLATSTLKLMRKGATALQNILFLKNCIMTGVVPGWNLLIGFPGEVEEVYMKYVRELPFLIHLHPPKGVFPVRFDRYSTYCNEPANYGLDLHPYDFYEMSYPFNKEALRKFAYYFKDNNFNSSYLRTMSKYIRKLREVIELWQHRWIDVDSIPQLYFKNKTKISIIYDSRSGKEVEHKISSIGRQVLERLANPTKLSELISDLGHIPNFDVEKKVRLFLEQGLIFQDDDSLISLVLNEEPPSQM